jgi:(p)ppGpp synthase/HD superfamily hydrolase
MMDVFWKDLDMPLIGSAFYLANNAHMDQVRKWEGEAPYIIHPVRVARLASQHIRLDGRHVAVALLHDTIEDTECTFETIRSVCGPYVATLVQELTNPSCKLPKETPRVEKKKLDFAHITGISSEAKILKMMDRLDNLSYGSAPSNFMRKYLPESLELAEICRSADEVYYQKLIDKIGSLYTL